MPWEFPVLAFIADRWASEEKEIWYDLSCVPVLHQASLGIQPRRGPPWKLYAFR